MTPDDVKDLFRYEHLPEHLQAVSKPFHDMAVKLVEDYSRISGARAGAMLTDALKMLWDTKNRVVWLHVEMKRLDDEYPKKPE